MSDKTTSIQMKQTHRYGKSHDGQWFALLGQSRRANSRFSFSSMKSMPFGHPSDTYGQLIHGGLGLIFRLVADWVFSARDTPPYKREDANAISRWPIQTETRSPIRSERPRGPLFGPYPTEALWFESSRHSPQLSERLMTRIESFASRNQTSCRLISLRLGPRQQTHHSPHVIEFHGSSVRQTATQQNPGSEVKRPSKSLNYSGNSPHRGAVKRPKKKTESPMPLVVQSLCVHWSRPLRRQVDQTSREGNPLHPGNQHLVLDELAIRRANQTMWRCCDQCRLDM